MLGTEILTTTGEKGVKIVSLRVLIMKFEKNEIKFCLGVVAYAISLRQVISSFGNDVQNEPDQPSFSGKEPLKTDNQR